MAPAHLHSNASRISLTQKEEAFLLRKHWFDICVSEIVHDVLRLGSCWFELSIADLLQHFTGMAILSQNESLYFAGI